MTDCIKGVGVGLRAPHYQHILNEKPDVPWFEVLTDNYMGAGGSPRNYLQRVCELYPITFHGVGLSLGSVDPLDKSYLSKLKALVQAFKPAWVSEHLCWSHFNGRHSNDLLPLPYTDESVNNIASKILSVQEVLGQRILLENVSSYLTVADSKMSEWAFYIEVVKQADCDMLLDINNIFVSGFNHQFSALQYIDAIPKSRVREIHLAGFEDMTTHYLDTHGAPVHEAVWQLYEVALQTFGDIPTLIEWDSNIPDWPSLYSEKLKADAIRARVFSKDNLITAHAENAPNLQVEV